MEKRMGVKAGLGSREKIWFGGRKIIKLAVTKVLLKFFLIKSMTKLEVKSNKEF